MRALFVIALFFVPFVASAQQGAVLYDETMRLDIELPPEMEHMRDRIPTEHTTQRLLLFEGTRSRMMAAPRDEEPEQLESGGRGMRFRMAMGGGDDYEVFTDHETGAQVERIEFMQRTFLITDAPRQLAWRLTGEQAEYLGYLTQKAVATTDDGEVVEAWFAPQIPAPVGPARFGGLPGLILIVSVDDGRRTYVARDVSLAVEFDAAIEAPTRGREVTREEFEAIVEERMRDMGGRGMRFHITN